MMRQRYLDGMRSTQQKRVKVVVLLDAADAKAIEAIRLKQPNETTRSALVRSAIRRWLHSSPTTIEVRA